MLKPLKTTGLETIARSPSSLLEAHESNSQAAKPPQVAQAEYAEAVTDLFRHAGWKETRGRVAASLKRVNAPVSRVMAFLACGYQAFLARSVDDPSRYKITGSGCRDRFCIPCARDRARVIGENVVDFLGNTPTRFLTLTLKHTDSPLTTQLDRLYNAFNALRRRRIFSDNVTGGMACLEVVYNHRGEWHPHFHCLLHGAYLPHKELRKAWFDITTDSFVLDIRMAQGHADVVRYVCKYVSKAFTGSISREPDKLDELVKALRGRKMVLTFGTWRELKTTAEPNEGKWEYVCTLTELAERAKRQAGEWLAILRTVAPYTADAILALIPECTEHPPPPPLDRRLVDQPFLIDCCRTVTF